MARPPGSDPETPFGLSWRTIYALVLGALAVQIVVYVVLTGLYQ
jgi:hypothetical protein